MPIPPCQDLWANGAPALTSLSLLRQHLLGFLLQFVIDCLGRTVTVDDTETVSGLEPLEFAGHPALVFEKAVEHVAREAQVHPALPIVQREVLGEIPLDENFRRYFEIEHRIGHQGNAVK